MQADSHMRDPNYFPGFGQGLMLGIQHVLAMFAGNVTVPIIIAGAIGADASERAFLIQAALLAAGIATLIQTIGLGPIGARLPIVQGTSFGFLPILVPLASSDFGMAAVIGGSVVCGVTQLFLGFWIRHLKHLIPPLVSGIVVTTIGLTLLKAGMDYFAGGAYLRQNNIPSYGSMKFLLLGFFVIVMILIMRQYFKGFMSASSIFFGMVLGYLVAIPLGLVNFETVSTAAWFSVPDPLHYGISFPLAAVIGMFLMAFVTTIETVGDISGVTMSGAERDATDRELSGGVMADGLGTAIGAVFNALPNTSYSQNVGLVAFTGLMSRHVVTLGAVFLVAAGLVPKFSALVSAMPQSVLGGAAIIMFGLVTAAGIKLIASSPMTRRNMLIIALSMGLGLGFYFVPESVQHFPSNIRILLESGLVPAAVIAVLLNAILPEQETEAN